MKRIAQLLGATAVALVAVLVLVKLMYGGGRPFPSRATQPRIENVEIAATLPFPPGCVTVSEDGRVFFDTHPFAAPGRFGEPHLFELVDGEPTPWPSKDAQRELVAPFGITTDRQGRLWVTEPATLDRSATRILAFDLETGSKVFERRLPDGTARFAQDLRVSPDGRFVVLADTGAFTFTPGQLLVVDTERGEIVRTFRHPSLNPQDWYIRRFDGDPHRVGWGLLTFQVGVDGITFSPDGRWLYYATMSHDTLYRIPAALLLDPAVPNDRLADAIEAVGEKPQSDGIAATAQGDILLADVENGGIAVVDRDGDLRTLTSSADVIWADSVEVAPNGDVWFTDSAIPAYLQQTMLPPTRDVLEAAGPYRLYRFRAP